MGAAGFQDTFDQGVMVELFQYRVMCHCMAPAFDNGLALAIFRIPRERGIHRATGRLEAAMHNRPVFTLGGFGFKLGG